MIARLRFAPAIVVFATMLAAPAANAAEPVLADLDALLPQTSCTSLAEVDLSGAVGAAVSSMASAEVAGERPYCKVTGTIAPAINFEVRLPMQGWTQRFLQTGCGGLCGSLNIRAEKAAGCTPVTDGQIVLASTDMGHQGMGMAWGVSPVQREDFAHRGVHLTTLAAKALIAAYYGQAPRFSYFSGCSDGGREALIAAQRYPDDFDGIAAGAPAHNFTVQNSFYHAWMARSNRGPDGQALLNVADMPVLHRAALAACDGADGLVDGQITNPARCVFDPAAVLCSTGVQPGTCLSPAQAEAARRIYAGPRDEQGRRLTPGAPMPGSELEWPGVFVPRQPGGPLSSERFALDTMNNLLWTIDPARPITLADLPFTAEAFASMEWARHLYSADDPDLSGFAGRGGRLLLWHGWSDQHISPMNTIDYFARMGTAMGSDERDAMSRLFMLPGMGHCAGGDGPSDFALLLALMSWVESGSAPDMLVAQRVDQPMAGPPGPAAAPAAALPPRSRPVFAYPYEAQYAGAGSIEDAASFTPVMPAAVLGAVDWIGAR